MVKKKESENKEISDLSYCKYVEFDKKNDDVFLLCIEYTKELKEHLKKVTVEGLPQTEFNIYDGNEHRTFFRALIKSAILNAVRIGNIKAVFENTLMTKGKIKFPFVSKDRLNSFLIEFETALEKVCMLISEISVKRTVTFNINYDINKK